MRQRKINTGPLVALALFLSGTGYVAAVCAAQLAPEPDLRTSLPLARI